MVKVTRSPGEGNGETYIINWAGLDTLILMIHRLEILIVKY